MDEQILLSDSVARFTAQHFKRALFALELEHFIGLFALL
jgi:hypothetical protein